MMNDLQSYPACKPSGVEWLGDVPAHWRVEALKRCCQINSETLSDDTDPDYQFDYLDISCAGTGLLVDSPEHMRFGDAPSRARRVMRRGDTALSTVRTYLKAVYHLDSDWPHLIASTGFAVLRPHPHTYPSFLGYYLRSESFVDQVTANSVGTAYPAIAESKLAGLSVVIPPLPEQAAIVRYLDHADRRIQRYIDGKERLIALLEEEKQATINQAVTRGLDPNVPLKPSGVQWLGDVPAHWEVSRSKTYYREVDERSITGTEALMSVSHLTGVTPRKSNVTMFMAESNEGYKICRPGDIVINTMWAYMAALGVANQTGIVSPSYGVYRPQNRVLYDTRYLDTLLRVQGYQVEYLSRSTGITSSRLRLYPDQFLNILLLNPPQAEQNAIMTYLETATAKLDGAIAGARRQIELLREYRTRLISDVVTGKLDVREAAANLPDVGADSNAPTLA